LLIYYTSKWTNKSQTFSHYSLHPWTIILFCSYKSIILNIKPCLLLSVLLMLSIILAAELWLISRHFSSSSHFSCALRVVILEIKSASNLNYWDIYSYVNTHFAVWSDRSSIFSQISSEVSHWFVKNIYTYISGQEVDSLSAIASFSRFLEVGLQIK
jgi:hypothetical protein